MSPRVLYLPEQVQQEAVVERELREAVVLVERELREVVLVERELRDVRLQLRPYRSLGDPPRRRACFLRN